MATFSVVATKVFVPHNELVWISAEVISETTPGNIEVRIMDKDLPKERGSKIISLQEHKLSSLPLHNVEIPEEGVDDMCALSYLHEPSILDNLRR